MSFRLILSHLSCLQQLVSLQNKSRGLLSRWLTKRSQELVTAWKPPELHAYRHLNGSQWKVLLFVARLQLHQHLVKLWRGKRQKWSEGRVRGNSCDTQKLKNKEISIDWWSNSIVKFFQTRHSTRSYLSVLIPGISNVPWARVSSVIRKHLPFPPCLSPPLRGGYERGGNTTLVVCSCVTVGLESLHTPPCVNDDMLMKPGDPHGHSVEELRWREI